MSGSASRTGANGEPWRYPLVHVDIPSEVVIGQDDGVPRTCAINVDNIQTIPKRNLGGLIAGLSSERMREVDRALAFALDLNLP